MPRSLIWISLSDRLQVQRSIDESREYTKLDRTEQRLSTLKGLPQLHNAVRAHFVRFHDRALFVEAAFTLAGSLHGLKNRRRLFSDRPRGCQYPVDDALHLFGGGRFKRHVALSRERQKGRIRQRCRHRLTERCETILRNARGCHQCASNGGTRCKQFEYLSIVVVVSKLADSRHCRKIWETVERA